MSERKGMSGISRTRRIGLSLLIALFALGCSLPFLTAAPSEPAQPAMDLEKVIELTANAAQTQTATFLPTATNTLPPTQVIFPTFTLPPTQTPLVLVTSTYTPTPAPLVLNPSGTLVSVTPAPLLILELGSDDTGSAGESPTSVNEGAVIKTPPPWGCKVLSKSPTTVRPGTKFYASWTVQNSGTKDWPYYGIDFVYRTGYRADGRPIQDLKNSVASGGTATLSVPITAPNREDSYNVFWSLKVGNTYFCPMKLTFEVKK
ncbi:MAG: hypothetical protein KA473_13730 [Anaerolineales bacterium]|nr:hypothetical protein [Anaerolineales bacterium]